MDFEFRHVARRNYPTKQIVVCEDDLLNQVAIAKLLSEMYDAQGDVQFSFVPGALQAAAIIQSSQDVRLIILDHDMPHGSGTDLIRWMTKNAPGIPVITFSGIDENNDAMVAASFVVNVSHFSKSRVLAGEANARIRDLVR
jgi:CheY-like chemotaxis protein